MALTYQFDADDSLITPEEVVEYAPVDNASYPRQRRPFIIGREEGLFGSCFGIKFYQDLMADRVKYMPSGEETSPELPYVNFVDGQVYPVGTHVLLEGRMYTVITLTTGKQRPPNQVYFKRAAKFLTAEYEYIWRRYLAQILAIAINNEGVYHRLIQDTPSGLIQKFEEGKSKPVSRGDVDFVSSKNHKLVAELIQTMEGFILANKTEPAYANYWRILKGPCVEDCAPVRRRHYGFNTNRRIY